MLTVTFIRQRYSSDCGIAALAMLCEVTYEEAYKAIPWGKRGWRQGTTTKEMRLGGENLGYFTVSDTKKHLLPIRNFAASRGGIDTQGCRVCNAIELWGIIPRNSLVKIPHPEGWGSHWVVWRNGKIHDPARGVFTPKKFVELFPDQRPTSFMQFIRRK